MTDLYGEAVGQEECDRIFQIADADGSGEISLQEFMQASVNRESLLDEKQLKISFSYFDKDGSGSVTIDELKEALGVGKNIDQ